MTADEFSNELDILLSSYPVMGQSPIVIDEYEKSVFLTKAQEEIVRELYNGTNNVRQSFEETEEVRRYLSPLIKTTTITTKVAGGGISTESILFNLPTDLLYITYTAVRFDDSRLECMNNREVPVIPTTQDEYYKVYNNPFRGPGIKRVLGLTPTKGMLEVVTKYKIKECLVRYISRPSPIIVTSLPLDLSIGGLTAQTECTLDPMIHRTILTRAAQLVLASKASPQGQVEK